MPGDPITSAVQPVSPVSTGQANMVNSPMPPVSSNARLTAPIRLWEMISRGITAPFSATPPGVDSVSILRAPKPRHDVGHWGYASSTALTQTRSPSVSTMRTVVPGRGLSGSRVRAVQSSPR